MVNNLTGALDYKKVSLSPVKKKRSVTKVMDQDFKSVEPKEQKCKFLLREDGTV